MALASTLDRLVGTLESRGHFVRSSLRPGLSVSTITAAFAPTGLTPPSELIELYQWHDGYDVEQAEVPLFGEHSFFSLQDAVRTYHRIVENYADPSALVDVSLCFPVAGLDGSYDTLYCYEKPFEGLTYPIIGIFYGISIEFENLEAMVLTAIEWAVNGVFDNYPVNETQIRAIKQRLNPRIPYRNSTY
jgi:hypothetical protein